MAAILWSDVEAHAPELATPAVSVAAQANILAHVNTALAVALLDGEDGPKTKITRIYLAAHFGTADALATGGAAGAVVSESAGGLSRSYGSAGSSFSMDPAFMALTGYGKNYLSMVRTSEARVPLLL